MKKSISIVIPAFNEEQNIAAAVTSVTEAIHDLVDDYEIIVVNDGSSDHTGEVAESLRGEMTKLKVVHNPRNMGFGYSCRTGMMLASQDYVGIFPGDNDMSALVFRQLLAESGHADIIISYMASACNRSFFRRALSRSFVWLLNYLFRLRMKYYNGPFICRLMLIRSIPLRSNGLTMIAETVVKFLKLGHSYRAVYFEHTGRKQGKSNALTFRSLKETIKFLFFLFHDIYFEPQFKPVPLANIK